MLDSRGRVPKRVLDNGLQGFGEFETPSRNAQDVQIVNRSNPLVDMSTSTRSGTVALELHWSTLTSTCICSVDSAIVVASLRSRIEKV